MAITLGISVGSNTYDSELNESSIPVYVTITWTHKGFNRYSQLGTLTINGTSFNFSSGFNASETSSGSQTLYSTIVCVRHNSDGSLTLNCSATYDTGVNAGIISVSTTKNFHNTPSGGGGSGGGGGGSSDSGNPTGPGTSNSTPEYFEYESDFCFILNEGINKVELYHNNSLYETFKKKNVSIYYDVRSNTHMNYKVIVYAENGYELSNCIHEYSDAFYNDGYDGDGISTISVSGSVSEFNIDNTYNRKFTFSAKVISPVRKIYIDNNSEYIGYQIYIDTVYEQRHPINTKGAGIYGSYSYGGTYTTGNKGNFDDITYTSSGGKTIGTISERTIDNMYYAAEYYAYIFSFKSNNFNGVSKYIRFNLTGDIVSYKENIPLNYALCSSDANYGLYVRNYGDIIEENQLVKGVVMPNQNSNLVIPLTIETNIVQPNTIYYLIIWPSKSFEGTQIILDDVSSNDVRIGYENYDKPLVPLSRFEQYIPYIDKGTRWDAYA